MESARAIGIQLIAVQFPAVHPDKECESKPVALKSGG
jgi:hypothetical protein